MKTSLNSYITVVIVHFIASTGVTALRKGRNYIAIVDNPADAMIIRKETSSIESLSSSEADNGEIREESEDDDRDNH